ncbi:MAG TPA: flagellar biosynthesis protein FlgB [Candidatus Ventrousia excrementavium]|uniref:Flagellar basal body rod protein FlgB n=1 Tax=Candidatus Ventrousia excrementavium TaxID=2840961 RepID=A0A9D1LL65_9CLOT|nr:flagellar biosynthesis protein FlgB [Candidatus Ventrousia excrementavium]
MELLGHNSLLMLEKSMDFLWTKQAAILDNISNAETPNYKTKVVTFEESLREKLDAAQRSRSPRTAVREVLEGAQFAVTEAQEATRMDENGVNLVEQSVELARNAYQLQYVYSAISSDLSALRTAIRGQ